MQPNPRRSIGDLWRLLKVHSLKWLAMCSSGCPTPKLQLVLFSETADQWQLGNSNCCIQSLQLTATAEDLPCKLGTSVEMVWVTWDDLHPLFRHGVFRLHDNQKRFLDRKCVGHLDFATVGWAKALHLYIHPLL